ncbi:hypothetical protein AYO40_05065 [Planctomycetaceae bacterium SCGC AG-212-D15]|nr:hypothetical protein AYO40_05065 [Planctomycetaceae bacterium SCGC AG-212-D15]
MRKCAGIYETESGTLFVPSDGMRLIHKASTPAAVFRRAFPKSTGHSIPWDRWSEDIQRWTYSGRARSTMIERWDGTPPSIPDAIREAVLAFRRETSPGAIIRGARELQRQQAKQPRHQRERRSGTGITLPTVMRWLMKYDGHTWLKPWLFQGQPLPHGVELVIPSAVTACRRAWHYRAICRRAVITEAMYVAWLEKLPLAWRPWLFGQDAPNGGFVIEEPLQRLRKAMWPQTIATEAGICWVDFAKWVRSPAIAAAFEWVVGWVESSRHRGEPPWPDHSLSEEDKARLLRYARRSKTTNCLEKAKPQVHAPFYRRALAAADMCGVREQLESYLRHRPPFQGVDRLRSGLVAPNLFLPTEAMLKFRVAAQVEATQHGLAQALKSAGIDRSTPGFYGWFLDFTNPREIEPPHPSTNGAVATPTHTVPPTLGNDEKPPEEPEAPPALSVLGMFQLRVLKALRHRFRTGTQLEGDLNCDRKRLYRDGLTPLVAQRKVANMLGRGFGYYRPDAPPPELAEISGEN